MISREERWVCLLGPKVALRPGASGGLASGVEDRPLRNDLRVRVCTFMKLANIFSV